MASMSSNWNYPTSVRFGAGRVAEVADACAEINITHALWVTDPVLAGLEITTDAIEQARAKGLQVTLFSDVRPNPVGSNVSDGVDVYRQAGCDGVVAFGGGSALDAAKAIALMVGQRRPLWDFEDVGDWYTRVDVSGMCPCVAVPTTSGTGSEVGRASVIVDEQARKKKIIFHPLMLPARVVADPALTTGLPAHVTAATGMDALSHNLEALCSPLFHPMAEGIAMEGIRLVRESLLDAYRDGQDIAARSMMMASSAMGATAFQKGLGGMHALGHPIGAWLNAHHGRTIAVVMPYVLRFNESAVADKLARCAAYIGLEDASYGGFVQWVLELRETLGIAHTLDTLGVTEDLIVGLAAEAAIDPSASTNPLPLDSKACEQLLRAGLSGVV
ncbi:MAG TPA: alcohol dehydrogenase [Myxococcales bacterium]|nr:alcohol dehydrogenase [Myxococcales bacterium]